eukprot:CAMPEP_0202484690 /NCGR_PEP_ID=MMETSP1361-20130828/3702_1 /ASSEMBLY_ACC=CAM_ASM_000849 /TAXON_ID=210615 /ORGANISM="Staurosira complex sp., Strain CCMP2646" /LENGTH=251 /DNA_ID=CAMNT_0049113401 /DNA_START=48 /DNA_END=803 /DNA_ORIENTATION=-
MSSFPPLQHSLPRSPRVNLARSPRADRGEDRWTGIFRGISESAHASETRTHQWPQGLLSKLSGDPGSSIEERRELPPGEHLLLPANPIFQTVLSDDTSVKADVTGSYTAGQPFYVIHFDADGKGLILEQPLVAPSTPRASNRKRLRSKDVVPESKQFKVVETKKKQGQGDDSMWQVSAISPLERFAEVIEALTPSMCVAVTKTNLGIMTPWHSHSSMNMHCVPRRQRSSTQTMPFHHKSYMATTLSSCRAF